MARSASKQRALNSKQLDCGFAAGVTTQNSRRSAVEDLQLNLAWKLLKAVSNRSSSVLLFRLDSFFSEAASHERNRSNQTRWWTGAREAQSLSLQFISSFFAVRRRRVQQTRGKKWKRNYREGGIKLRWVIRIWDGRRMSHAYQVRKSGQIAENWARRCVTDKKPHQAAKVLVHVGCHDSGPLFANGLRWRRQWQLKNPESVVTEAWLIFIREHWAASFGRHFLHCSIRSLKYTQKMICK